MIQHTPTLSAQFATELPELAVPTRVEPCDHPTLAILNTTLARNLGLDPTWLRSPDGISFLLGQHTDTSVAQAYAGHQFGQFVPSLGDGRAVLLGELSTPNGALYDIHLKGTGTTPFTRLGGDGYAPLHAMLREYLISEAMHALGVASTRTLAVVDTHHNIRRTHFEPAAVLVRVAASHLRVGTFQYAAAFGDLGLLERLSTHTRHRHYPHTKDAAELFQAVITAQAELVARWMGIGFIHGALNTDNTTISGETIDYGPCAFLDAHNPATVYSSVDAHGRYAYGQQPTIIGWNLARLSETLLPLLHPDPNTALSMAYEILGTYSDSYRDAWARELAEKIDVNVSEKDLLTSLDTLLKKTQPDHTLFFRNLSAATTGDDEPILGLFDTPLGDADARAWKNWLGAWRTHHPDPEKLNQKNPLYIPRNHLVEHALSSAVAGEMSAFDELLWALTSPFTPQPGFEHYAQPAPDAFGPYRTFCGT